MNKSLQIVKKSTKNKELLSIKQKEKKCLKKERQEF